MHSPALIRLLPAVPVLMTLGWALAGVDAQAQQKAGSMIYSCEINGKRITSDRPIPECASREQRVLNSDGSVREVRPPMPTADERAEIEARQQQEALARSQQREAVRRDRNLLQRFPTQAAHDKARVAALDDVRANLKISEDRLAVLQKERRPLTDEAEFYVGRQMPLRLRQQLDANDASTEAQRNLLVNQQAEIVRINKRYDDELERLRKLWAGAMPGSLGMLAATEPAASAPRGRAQP